jgi:4-amino-4-deoxy-L-arabinose transferase-like glycosyltransferase
MKKFIHLCQNSYFQGALIVILILYQLARLIAFVNIYGGVDHDSGWFLGVARSLAETGRYATLVSTLPNPEVTGGIDINQEFFQIQDEDGRVYFFIEGAVGPTQIIPNAIVIKLFGSGFWQFRAIPLLFYTLFLFLTSWLLLSMGGFFAVLLFHTYLFFYPHLSVYLGYEALGEVPLVTFLLLSFILYTKATTSNSHRPYWFILSGMVAALAIISKAISLLALSSLGLLWLVLYYQKRTTLKEGLVTASSALCLLISWELIKLITIAQLFSFDLYLRHWPGRLNFFTTRSGISEEVASGTEFFWYKFLLISEISHPNWILSLAFLLIIAASGPFLIWHFRASRLQQNFVVLLWGGWSAHTLWFIFIAENGWVRRYWVALILAILLLCLVWSILLHRGKTQSNWLNWSLFVAVTLLIGVNLYSQKQVITLIMSDNLVEYWYQKHLAAPRTQLPEIIVPRKDQENAVIAIQQLPASARVFYPGGHKSAEMGVLTGRILYPLERRAFMPAAQGDVIVVGPSLISPWTKLMERSMNQAERDNIINNVRQQVKQECPNPIFENSYYIICAL